jgi:hypothetical protein
MSSVELHGPTADSKIRRIEESKKKGRECRMWLASWPDGGLRPLNGA